MSPHLVLGVAATVLAVPAAAVVEIVHEPRFTRPPQAPAVLAGLMVLRGAAVPVVDLSRLLALDGLRPGAFRPVVVLRHAVAGPWGVLVERAHEVVEAVARPAPGDTSLDDTVTGLLDWRAVAVPVLDPERLLRRREAQALADLGRWARLREEEGFGLGPH